MSFSMELIELEGKHKNGLIYGTELEETLKPNKNQKRFLEKHKRFSQPIRTPLDLDVGKAKTKFYFSIL